MSPLLIALPAAAAAGLAAWRVALVRRRAAARRAARDRAAKAALKAARRSVAKAPATPDPARADIEAGRAMARARADRVIAAETARRDAEFRKTREAHDAADRRAAEAAAALMATLPMPHRAELEHAAPTPPAMKPGIPKTAAETLILTVDDSKMVRVKSNRLLAAHGFQVITAVDGLDALTQMQACSPDLIITDVEMPGMDGFGLVNALRGDPRTHHIPVVMITSAEDRHRADAQRAGVGLMMGKPYDEAALIAHIRGLGFFADTERTASAARG